MPARHRILVVLERNEGMMLFLFFFILILAKYSGLFTNCDYLGHFKCKPNVPSALTIMILLSGDLYI